MDDTSRLRDLKLSVVKLQTIVDDIAQDIPGGAHLELCALAKQIFKNVDELKFLENDASDVTASSPSRPLDDDDIVEICDKNSVRPVRVLVRHLPRKLREVCDWLAPTCAYQGRRFELFDLGTVNVLEILDEEKLELLCSEIAERVDPQDEDNWEKTFVSYGISVKTMAEYLILICVFGVQNKMADEDLQPWGWSTRIEGYVSDLTLTIRSEFATSVILEGLNRECNLQEAGRAIHKVVTTLRCAFDEALLIADGKSLLVERNEFSTAETQYGAEGDGVYLGHSRFCLVVNNDDNVVDLLEVKLFLDHWKW